MMVVVYEDGPYYTLISPWLCKEAEVCKEEEEELEEEGKEEGKEEETQGTWGFVIPDALHWSLLINLKETITFYTTYRYLRYTLRILNVIHTYNYEKEGGTERSIMYHNH